MDIQWLSMVPRSPRKSVHQVRESVSSIVSPFSRGDASYYERASLQCRNDFYRFMSDTEENEVDPKMAAMRVFAVILLNSWRRRKDEVRRLNDELDRMKKISVKAKSQIHVISSLFKVEQKTNDGLNTRLRRVLEEQKKLQNLYSALNKAYISLQGKNSEIDRLMEEKTKEIDGLNNLLGDSKANLFKTMARERELETCLSHQQRKSTELQSEKFELLSTITQLEQCIAAKLTIEKALDEKKSEVATLKSELNQLEKKLKDLNEKEALIKEYQQQNISQRNDIQELTDKVNTLEAEAKNTFLEHSKGFLKNFQESTVRYSHVALHLLLPMTPKPPNVNLGTPSVLQKAFQFCWR